jgi:hypothetical protein
LPQLFDFFEQGISGLLAQNLAQQHSQRAHVTPQGRFLQIAGAGLKLRKPIRPTVRFPKRWHYLNYA